MEIQEQSSPAQAEEEYSQLIRREQQIGRAARSNPAPRMRQILTLSKREKSRLLDVLMGASAGMQAGAASGGLDSPILSGIAGAAAGVSAPAAFRADQAKLSVQALDAQQINVVAPRLVQKIPEISGMSVATVRQLAPLFQRVEQLELLAAFKDKELDLKRKAEARKGRESAARGEDPRRKRLRDIEAVLTDPMKALSLKGSNRAAYERQVLEAEQLRKALGMPTEASVRTQAPSAPRSGMVRVRAPNGQTGWVPAAKLQQKLQMGYVQIQ